MNQRAFEGLLNAAPQKRYQHFVSAAADGEQVWLYKGNPWCVWAEREFAVHLMPEEQLIQMNVHNLCFKLLTEAAENDIMISVFPNGSDSEIGSADTLREALIEELDMLE